MVTSHHEASHRIFQERPELLAPVFDLLGVPLPAKAAVAVLSPDATEIRPLERRVDTVLRVDSPDDGEFLLAIEAQGRRDSEKAVSWAYYLSLLKAKHGCPALLVVVGNDRGTATWASGPFRLGRPGWTALTVHPLVLGPDNVPVITDQEEASRNLAMATFSAMTHGRHPQARAILEALAGALGAADGDSVKYYAELLEIGLGDTPAREIWRNLMGVVGSYFPGRGTIIEEKFLEGKAAGEATDRARMVLRLLERREVAVPESVRERVTGCSDLEILDRWFDRALTAANASEIFAEE